MNADLLWPALQETLRMVGISAALTAVGGLIIGILLAVTARDGLVPQPVVNKVLGFVVNVGRSLPFIILLIAISPLTREIVGKTIGTEAMIVPLTAGAIPFFARLVETALREVDPGVVQAARAMGTTRSAIVRKVLFREARPGLLAGFVVTVIALVGYSAMAGTLGGGGLGDLAIRYGYQRFETDIMIACVVVLIVLVQLIQMLGDLVVRRLSHK